MVLVKEFWETVYQICQTARCWIAFTDSYLTRDEEEEKE